MEAFNIAFEDVCGEPRLSKEAVQHLDAAYIARVEKDVALQDVGAGRLRDLCFGDDQTDFFIAEWRAEDVHADVGGDSPQLGYVSGKKAPPLDILEEAFETARGERHRETDALGTIGPPSVRTELR
jgi:hypothetical protein